MVDDSTPRERPRPNPPTDVKEPSNVRPAHDPVPDKPPRANWQGKSGEGENVNE